MSDLRNKANELGEKAAEAISLPNTWGNSSPEFVAACLDSSKALSLLAITVHLDRIATALEKD